jgi:hypothetical protein
VPPAVTYLTEEQFFELFHTFDHTAFRLEVRESYAGVDESAFRQFLSGELASLDSYESWMQNVREQTASGKRIERVRVVSEPWSDYTRFGLWACRTTIDAGEDIRYLARSRALPLGLPAYDYWLFDSQQLVLIHFDDKTNEILRLEVVSDPAAVVRHNHWRDAAWLHALPRDEYIGRVGDLVLEPPASA